MCASMVGMSPDANAGAQPATGDSEAEDLVRLQEYATALAEGIDRALPAWVIRQVARVHQAWTGEPEASDGPVHEAALVAAQRALVDVGPRVHGLLVLDIDEQRSNPLALVRRAVTYPTEVLREAGVPPVARDAQAEEHFPDDDYDLTPGSFADLDPALQEPGLLWGAAKAHVHLRRRRAEGLR